MHIGGGVGEIEARAWRWWEKEIITKYFPIQLTSRTHFCLKLLKYFRIATIFLERGEAIKGFFSSLQYTFVLGNKTENKHVTELSLFFF